MYWQNLENKTIGIWGSGKEGNAAKTAILQHVVQKEIIDISEDNLDDIYRCQVVVKSPGVSLYRGEIVKAKGEGVKFTSSSNLFFANRAKDTNIVAITGTKGKSTTSSLLAHTLKELGIEVELAGNIGRPLVELVDTKAKWVIAEMSSYQCADLAYGADIGVLLNLYPEHLQWHGSHERYYADKINMLVQAELKVLNTSDERSQKITHFDDAIYFNDTNAIHINDGYFYDGQNKLFATSFLPLLGEHNAQNACAVLTVIKAMGLNVKNCEKAFATFKGLKHRLDIIGEYNGITFVDDSISTTPETAIAALKALDKGQYLTLLAGGFDRGQDYKGLAEYTSSIKDRCTIITLPDTGVRVSAEADKYGIKTIAVANMTEAVEQAFRITPQGGAVILSPAAPSYNCYKNFEERGEDFANCVKSLAK